MIIIEMTFHSLTVAIFTNNVLFKVDWETYRKNKSENISKHTSQASPVIAKQNSKFVGRTDSPREDFAYVNNYLQDPKNKQPSSPSIRTIMTTATKVNICPI